MELTVILQAGVAVTLTSNGPTVTLTSNGPTVTLAPLVSSPVINPDSSRVVTIHAGIPGPNAEHVILTLAAYLALDPEVQMDGRWYVIPK